MLACPVVFPKPNTTNEQSSNGNGPTGICTDDNNLGSTHCEPRVVMWAKLSSLFCSTGWCYRGLHRHQWRKNLAMRHIAVWWCDRTHTYSVISCNYRHCVRICLRGVAMDITMTIKVYAARYCQQLCFQFIILSITDIARQISTGRSLSVPTIECSVSLLVTE